MENYKELLTKLYQEHAPEKIKQIDFYLDRYKGKEKQFYITQKAKYANKKSVKDSKKILEEAMARLKKKQAENKSTKTESNSHTSTQSTSSDGKKLTFLERQELKQKAQKEEKTEAIKKETPITPVITPKEEEIKTEKPILKEKPIVEKPIIKEEVPKAKKIEEPKQEKSDLKKESTPPVSRTSIKEIEQKEAEQEKKNQESAISGISIEEWKKEKEKLRKSKEDTFEEPIKPKKEKRKKPIPVLWYFAIASIIIILVAILIYFLHFRDSSNKDEVIHIQKVKVENKAVEVNTKDSIKTDAIPSSTNENIKEEIKDENPVTTNTTEEPKKKQVKEKPKEKPVKKKNNTRPSSERIYSKDLQKPAVFVGCFAVKTEALAQKKIEVLKKYNLDAHYYWIPDLRPNGNEYFKVVAGPFSSVREAGPSLTKAQERINFDAYIIIIK